ncbi:histidinol phosphatase [Aquimarina sp. U1-2]|uniref:tyrosine-protein phosphatase n=1 Tax=Aquimarina sp. U1-2 TaxID=2823141 RepID=UPI001AECFC5B|nr:CpsB/CapC family capsule biosynthesis tyrosine phosphatase [Aquimarina sp. U1-2]MBP2831997.1 histidinol phosphatase [Aquimarina sp. U1-2]
MSFFLKKRVPFSKLIPENYVDIHSHLLPGIDDGVKTMYQSAYILEQFEKFGIQKVITTPHIMQQVWPNSSTTISQGLEKIRSILPTLGIHQIHLHASAEYMMDDLFYQRLKSKDILPLHGDYILVEMSTFSPPIHLKEILFEIKVAGYIPILAHPERYSFYHKKDLNEYEELKESGFLFQLNLLSLTGHYGRTIKKVAEKMLKQGHFDFTGTDIHNYHHLEILERGFHYKLAPKLTRLMQNNSVLS